MQSAKFFRINQKLVYLGLGSNLGNRLENLRKAIDRLSESGVFKICNISHVVETPAILQKGSPKEWDLPYLNMVISGTTKHTPQALLMEIKTIENSMGRPSLDPKWSPRIIDIDILDFYNQKIETEHLKIPHTEIKNRDFIRYSLTELGWSDKKEGGKNKDGIKFDFENFKAINHFVLYPKFVGIVNITPDSFSDGGRFLHPDMAEKQIGKLVSEGASMLDLGAQSTRPGYTEVSAKEEISRLSAVLERCYNQASKIHNEAIFSLDTYFDEVLMYAIRNYPGLISCANVQQFKLQKETIKMIADNSMKLIVMLHGMDLSWLDVTVKTLKNWGIDPPNIIIDPGIGFGKNKWQNIEIVRNLKNFRQFGCEIMLGHSRKSFISAFSNSKKPMNRDLETIAISDTAYTAGVVDYLRVHNVKDHMRFFVAKKIVEWVYKNPLARTT